MWLMWIVIIAILLIHLIVGWMSYNDIKRKKNGKH